LLSAITLFPLAKAHTNPGALTVGPDGNLWFSEPNPGRIGQTVVEAFPPPASVTGVGAVPNSRKAITSILVSFDDALDPASARKDRFYGLAAGVKRVQTIIFDGSTKREKIARV
jgi:hypothetical protein